MLFRLFPKASKCSSTKPWKRVDSDGINVPSDCPSYFGADAGESDNDATRLPRKTRRIARKGNGDVASSKSEIKVTSRSRNRAPRLLLPLPIEMTGPGMGNS